jgi:chromosome segregation ATPase
MLLAIVSVIAVFTATGVRAAGSDVSEEVKEAAAAIGEFSVEQKDAAMEKAKEMMDNLDDRIHELEGKTEANWDDMKQSSRESYNSTMKELRKKRNNLSEWYGSMKHSSKEAWNEVKSGFAKSYDSLVQSWQDAADEMKSEK